MFFGEYAGGELVVEEPGGDRVLSEKSVWHRFSGRDHFHYNLPHTGDKLSIVAYSQNAPAAAKRGKHRAATGAPDQNV